MGRFPEEIKFYAEICKTKHRKDKPEKNFKLVETHLIPNIISKMNQFQYLPFEEQITTAKRLWRRRSSRWEKLLKNFLQNGRILQATETLFDILHLSNLFLKL